jgi:Yip1 domain
MICAVCGQSYGITHNCPNVAPLLESEEPPSKLGFPPAYYFMQGWKIIFWDDAAIRRNSRDPNALIYGILFWIVGASLPLLLNILIAVSNSVHLEPSRLALSLGIVIAGILVEFLRFGICHLLAKQFFGGDGKFLPLIRALFLGSVASWLIVVPVLGTLLAGIATTIVIMVVFEELDHIERMQAFLLAVGVNVAFAVLIYYAVSAMA